MSNVTQLRLLKTGDVSGVKNVLTGAAEDVVLTDVVVVGWADDGELYVASNSRVSEAVFLLEAAKLKIMGAVD